MMEIIHDRLMLMPMLWKMLVSTMERPEMEPTINLLGTKK